MSAVKTALTSLRRSPYQSMLAVSVMTILFFVANLFALSLMGAEQILRFFETRPQVIAFFLPQVADEVITNAGNVMKAKSYVGEVRVVTKTQALELYQKDNKDNPLLLELVTADILPASLEVTARQASDLNQIKQDLKAQNGIDEVTFQDDVLNSLLQWTKSLRIAGLFAVSVLAVTAFLTIVVLVSMKTITRKKAVSIMQIIGATNGYILAPFVTEGLLYGLTGALLGWALMWGVLLYATPWLSSFLGGIVTFPVQFQILLACLGASALGGIIIGSLASLVAARRLLRS
jgi:cell division transport system permease protein